MACWGENYDGQASPPAGTFTQVSAGDFHTCGVGTDGTVACWGENRNGRASPPAGTFTQVSAGGFHTCGVRTDGTVACWGYNGFGQATPAIPPTGTFTQVSAGPDHTCGVGSDGTVACWGSSILGKASPAITSPPPSNGSVGSAYSHTFTTTFLSLAPTFRLTSGTLAPGLVLSSQGVLSGTPTSSGSFGPTTVCAANGIAPEACQTFTVTIAAVHPQSLPGVVASSTNWSLRDSLTAVAATATFTYGARPPALVPLTGDWDGNGTKTPGIFQGGEFKLRNANSGGGADVTFAFGDPRGFPLSGDFDGNGVDDVAVFRGGTWQVRHLGPGAAADTTFSFGSGTWPGVVPVAGDWDGDGIDGIGYFCRDGVACPAGTWNLRQSASGGPPELSFLYNPGTGPYPVVGDWDADGDDTVGVKAGTTWLLNNANDASTPDVTFDFGGASDLPVVWAR